MKTEIIKFKTFKSKDGSKSKNGVLNIYRGTYSKLFNILNKDLLFGFGELFDSEKSFIKDGYWNIILEDENGNNINLESYLDCEKFEKIKKLNIEIVENNG